MSVRELAGAALVGLAAWLGLGPASAPRRQAPEPEPGPAPDPLYAPIFTPAGAGDIVTSSSSSSSRSDYIAPAPASPYFPSAPPADYAPALSTPAAAPTVSAAAGWRQATPWDQLFERASAQHALPAGLLKRVAWQESRFNPAAVSPAGAQGLMQIVPRWHPDVDPFNPGAAIPYAAAYLAQLRRQFGSWELALAGYNWGPGNLARALRDDSITWPAETIAYLRDVGADVALA